MFEGINILQYVVELVIFVWFLAAIANKDKRSNLRETLSGVVSAPPLFSKSAEEQESNVISLEAL